MEEFIMYDSMVRDVLREWKDDAKVTHLMLYSLRKNVLTVYTDRPGPLIGCRGERIARYQEKLKALPFSRITEVRLEETDGIF
jgi:ribosomal protein S3